MTDTAYTHYAALRQKAIAAAIKDLDRTYKDSKKSSVQELAKFMTECIALIGALSNDVYIRTGKSLTDLGHDDHLDECRYGILRGILTDANVRFDDALDAEQARNPIYINAVALFEESLKDTKE